MLPFDLWKYIFEFLNGDILSQLRLKSVNKELHVLQITDLFNINRKYQMALTDDILKKISHVTLLYASRNLKITDNGIIHMYNLHTLNASDNSKLTDNGIQHMTNLHTLYAYHNKNITDNGIKHLTNLYNLCAYHN